MSNLRRNIITNTISDSGHQACFDARFGEHFVNHEAGRGFAVGASHADDAHIVRWITGLGGSGSSCQ